MSLSLTNRRHDKAPMPSSSFRSNQWSGSQQHLSQDYHQLQLVHQTTVRKQRSFIETPTTSRPHLTRGLSVGRSSKDIHYLQNRNALRKHSTFVGAKGTSSTKLFHADDLIKKNINACSQLERPPTRSVQAWSSTSSILKSLDKELAQLNGVLVKSKDVRNSITKSGVVDKARHQIANKSANKHKTETGLPANVKATTSSNRLIKSATTTSIATVPSKTCESNKVNLSIVLSHALNESKENDYILCDPGEGEDSEDLSIESEHLEDSNKSEVNLSKDRESVNLSAPQRRALYQSSKFNDQINLSNACQTPPQPQLQNLSPALIVQKRPPLVRAMSAPVRSIDDNSKGSFLANNKRKSRRRKLNARTITCDRDSSSPSSTTRSTHLTNVNNLNFDSKSTNKKILQRSRSVAPDVITLVSLISSEGSDSEKEDCCSSTPSNSDSSSPTRRAPSLRKAGKSVSFQENYPPTFQFASKEYSHMLRRGSIAPLAARIKANRPPTAPPGSIFHTNNNSSNSNSATNTKNMNVENDENDTPPDENQINANNNVTTTTPATANLKKSLEEESSYQYPDYVRSIKERECWKLFQKMSAKGVNITYDTILRGMLTPTEFRQLQKQREMEEAKAQLRENEEMAAINEEQQQQLKNNRKNSPLERIAENLPKN
ncbi:J domain-containing protein DDB_G0295729 [Musca domestica]|uniref:J domain-containing protein DDB_G0295729 n=2 Tax=Musca domestica TaxID=7370 RepID=A0A9J7HX42_MUSDO|nr:J domain-containing protein DDB_G0295729 [Musca domestica]